MLSHIIFESSIRGDREAITTSNRSVTWSQLRKQALLMVDVCRRLARRRVGLCLNGGSESYAMLAALDRLVSDVFLLDARLPIEEIPHLAEKLRLGAIILPAKAERESEFEVREVPNEDEASGSSSVTILTSGTSGEPKAATHSWGSLYRPVRENSTDIAPRWLLSYRPNLYAGLQVMLQCFANHGTLVIPDSDMDSGSLVRYMARSGVQFVSGTPSFWRRLLMFTEMRTLRQIPLAQVTLGGEVVDQPLLDRLKRTFPQARIVHIYATTELGRCFSVNDGLAGFPFGYLESPLPDGVRLKIVEGELLIQSPNSMRTYDRCSSVQYKADQWFHTGDMVEIRGNRGYFAGRVSDLINVGGSKVHPIEVERIIRVIPGVSDVRVFGRTSSIAGEIVACEILAAPNQNPEDLRDEVIRQCRAQLAPYQQPRIVKLVSQIDLSSAGKVRRTKVQ